MKERKLTVSILQMPVADDSAENLAYIERSVDDLMNGSARPELIVGVEFGISKNRSDTIPGKLTACLSSIAKSHGIYFIPGTMLERSTELPKGKIFNTCPIFSPDGEMITAYRKRAPFKMMERHTVPGEEGNFCLFEIKGIKIGVLVCYDQFFPEIPRTLALMGAELLVCPSYELLEYDFISDTIPRVRALENDAYYIWTCGTGTSRLGTCCGHSIIVDPEGLVVHKCGSLPELYTVELDFENVTKKRPRTKERNLNSNLDELRHLRIKSFYNDNLDEAPVYKHGK